MQSLIFPHWDRRNWAFLGSRFCLTPPTITFLRREPRESTQNLSRHTRTHRKESGPVLSLSRGTEALWFHIKTTRSWALRKKISFNSVHCHIVVENWEEAMADIWASFSAYEWNLLYRQKKRWRPTLCLGSNSISHWGGLVSCKLLLKELIPAQWSCSAKPI